MNLIRGVNVFERIRERVLGMIVVAGLSACCFVGGVIMAFYVSPSQAIEWRQIQGMPEQSANSFASVSTGEEVVITGTLADNVTLQDEGYVVLIVDEYQVEFDEENEEYDGSWTEIERTVPALTLSLPDGTVSTQGVSSARVNGNTHESIIRSSGITRSGTDYPEGSIRYEGFFNGDLVTIAGSKASTGDLIPDRIFGGDRVELVDYIQKQAQGAFRAGIAMMICAPIGFVFLSLMVIFGRTRRRGLGRVLG